MCIHGALSSLCCPVAEATREVPIAVQVANADNQHKLSGRPA